MTRDDWAYQAWSTHFAGRFGTDPLLDPLPSERDANAKVTLPDSIAVLKRQQARDMPWLELQDLALRAAAASGRPVPMPLHERIHADSDDHVLRLLTWIDGVPWAEAEATAEHLEQLGELIADVDLALAAMPLSEPQQQVLDRPFRWNMLQAVELLDALDLIQDEALRSACRSALQELAAQWLPDLHQMPMQAIHNDANDYNVIMGPDGQLGLIDFGDIVRAPRIVGLATAAAYAATRVAEPVRDICPVIRGYHRRVPLNPQELQVLPGLIQARLAMSVLNAAEQSAADPQNGYLLVSQDVVPRTLLEWRKQDEHLTWFRFRDACGYDPNPAARAVRQHLATVAERSCVLPMPAASSAIGVLDWSATGPASPRTAEELQAHQERHGMEVLLGRYGEERDIYRDAAFDPNGESARTVHLGIDLFAPAGTPVYAPLDGTIDAFADNHRWLDYGPVLLLRHHTHDGTPFWTLMGHLSVASMASWEVGRAVRAGEQVATVGTTEENVGWPPHVHLQVLTDLCGMGLDVYGVAPRDEISLWRGISPNPALLLGLDPALDAHADTPTARIRAERSVRLPANLSLNYRGPVQVVRGSGAYLFDEQGRAYLDLVNNVAHVGHAHPYVNARAAEQASRLNTNTRYLHHAIVEYARNLAATLPDPLSVVFFVNSGSEANDLAMRLARAHTRANGWVCLRHAYHGHTAAVVDISPYKFLGPGGLGTAPNVLVADLPDARGGAHRGHDAGARYARDLASVLESFDEPLAGFICEGIVSSAGQVVLADEYLAAAYRTIRSAGGVCIADEVQIGMGRVGSHFWGFELHGVTPDIVTMGKPIGNGHPLAAVVTTPQIAASFHNGMEYFNTFGGNPVSMAIGQAVLDVVQLERLQAAATEVGAYLRAGVSQLAATYPLIADVRGHGLFIGVELTDEDGRPATAQTAWLLEEAKAQGVFLSSDGPAGNVLKIKPALVLQHSDVDLFLSVLDACLQRLPGSH